MMEGSLRPFSGGWLTGEPQEALVLDSWRHRQVQDSRGVGDAGEGAPRSLTGLDTLHYSEETRRSGDSPTVSLTDLRLSAGTGFSLDARPGRVVAELSERRRDAIRGAWRRVDGKGQGAVGLQEFALALQRFSHLQPPEQEQLLQAVCGRAEPQSGLRVTWGLFAGYYQSLGSTIERDRDFEDLVRHHWGFAEVSDLLTDMKNKFAMVGLAYAFRRSLEPNGSPELSLESFQEAISRVGMNYSSGDVSRLFDAFAPGATPGEAKSLEVQRLTQHLTSAPRPRTPVPRLEAASTDQAAYHDGSAMGHAGPGSPLGRRMPGTVPAPTEREPRSLVLPPLAPPEREDDDEVAHAPLEFETLCNLRPPEAPPEDDDGEVAPPERLSEADDAEPPEAPTERAVTPGMRMSTPARLGGTPKASAGTRPPRRASGTKRTGALPTVPAPAAGCRRAVTVGVDYLGLPCQLAGCVNDSDTFITLLTEDFGYDVADIRQLRDDHPQRMPTRKNINAALRWLVHGAKEGDHLLFHYSGHGSQQTDVSGDEMDGKDETIVPCDYQQNGMISDDELRRVLVQNLPRGVRLTVILDCCHSGTAIDLPYKVLMSGQTAVMRRKAPNRLPNPSEGDVVLLSGCRDSQTSADISAGALGNTQAAGAMTTAFRSAICKHPHGSFYTVLSEMRHFLSSRGYSQEPQLSSEHFLNLTECFLPEAGQDELPPERPMRPPVRKAVTIGINYLSLWPGQGRLSGCINDSDTMIGVLREVFRFEDAQIVRLRDDQPNVMPTRANILAALHWLTQGAQSGDEMFLHYSGHGGQQRDTDGDEESGKDDTIIPCDFQTSGQITDDELHAHIVAPLPKGTRLWAVLDCCHSGTALDLPYRAQIASDGRSLQLQVGGRRRASSAPRPDASGADIILLSGCKDTQTSADVQAGAMGTTEAAGAMTTAFKQSISATVSCEELLLRMRQVLKRGGYQQLPQMSSERFVQLDSGFLGYEGHGKGRMPPPPDGEAKQPTTPSQPQQSTSPKPVSPKTQAPPAMEQVDTSKYVMDTRINRLEEQIAQLRMANPSQQDTAYPGGRQYPLSQAAVHDPLSWGQPPGAPVPWGQGHHPFGMASYA